MNDDITKSANLMKWLMQKTHLEALFKNNEERGKWTKYKSDHEQLLNNLTVFRKNLKVKIMVPIGNKALMPGHLVHTNEILSSVGDSWFVKQTVDDALEMCQRRIKKCDEQLMKLDKEKQLLESRSEFPLKQNAFADEISNEIVEPYEEELEKKWRLEHREKEKHYRKKLAETKKNMGAHKIENEEDLWKHLDALELQEELQDELNRMGCDTDDDDEYECDDEDESSLDSDDDPPEQNPKTRNPLVEINPTADNIMRNPVDATPPAAFGDIVERASNSETGQAPPRRVSQFKASRSSMKR